MIALVFDVIDFSIFDGSILNVSDSISTKTGLAFCTTITLDVAAKVNGVVITSSPFLIPNASNERCNAAVPELTVTAFSIPKYFENSYSNFLL